MASSDSFNSQQLGPYTLLQRLGGGSTGIVYKAQHAASGQVVAVKVLSPSMARNPTAVTRFQREFDATRRLKHPCIVRALEFGRVRALCYLAMEYIEGASLETRLEEQGTLREEQALHIAVQIGDALDHAHKQDLIHRDIKPSNILLTPSGDARLTDFGLVKSLDVSSSLTETASVMGTPNFMAPEQFDDARQVDARSDLYALAATLYAAVTGVTPFEGRGYLSMVEKKFAGELAPPRDLNPELSERTAKAIMRALSVSPEDRPKSCAAFIAELCGRSHRAWVCRHAAESIFQRVRRWFWPYRKQLSRS